MGGSLLGGLLSNPALLSALPQLMSSLGPLLGGGGQKSAQPSPASQPQEGDSPSAAPQPKAGIPLDRHTALLCAIKPYLGKDRQAAAEYMIQMCRVLSTLQGMGISIPSLMASMPKHQGESAMGSQED